MDERRIESDLSRGSAWALAIGSICCLLAVVVAVMVVLDVGPLGRGAGLAVCAALAVTGAIGVLRALRYGKSVLVLEHAPSSLGATLAGSIETKLAIPAGARATTTLTCDVTTRSGGKSVTASRFSETNEVVVAKGAEGRAEIPVRHALPSAAPISGEIEDDRTLAITEWHLAVEVDAPAGRYAAVFPLRVVR